MAPKATEVDPHIPFHDHKNTKVEDEEVPRVVAIRLVRVGDNVGVEGRIVARIFMLTSKDTHIGFKGCPCVYITVNSLLGTVSFLPE